MDVQNIDIFDTDILGKIDNRGNLIVYTGKEALANSIKLWLTSFRADCLRSLNRGGYITQHLYKPMSDYSKREIRNAIADGFRQDYTPYVELQTLDVNPDYENKTWEINLEVYAPTIKDTTTVSVIIRNFV